MPKTHAEMRPPRGTGTLHFLTTALYAAFAIPVTIVALNMAWPAGVGLAVIFAVFWPRMPRHLRGHALTAAVDRLRPEVPADRPTASGNASFDAYRKEMLDRLEKEQTRFDGFLGRLREAKDTAEFDAFMEDRARAARLGSNDPREVRPPAPPPATPASDGGMPELRAPGTAG